MNRIFFTTTLVAFIGLQLFVLPKISVFAQSSASIFSDTDSIETLSIPINIESSIIYWKGTKVSGQHEGTLKLKEGVIEYNDNHITGGYFIADMNTIAITDIPKHEKEARKNLREHLKDQDFFYVGKYPIAKFEIIETKRLEADKILITGNLSIRDVTKQISIEASQNTNAQSYLEFNTSFSFNRFDWNVAYQGSYWDRMSSILDNNLVHKEISLSILLITDPVPEYN